MKRLVLVRHAHDDRRNLTGGWTDPGLTPLGRRQAAATGRRLAEGVDRQCIDFVASDLRRAVETAQIIGQFISVAPRFVQSLRELNNGRAAGLTVAEAERIALPVTEPVLDWAPYPGAETWRQMEQRVVAFLEALSAETDQALIVSHGWPCVVAVHWWLRLDERCRSRCSYSFDHGSVTWLDVTDWGERRIVRLNDVSHQGNTKGWSIGA